MEDRMSYSIELERRAKQEDLEAQTELAACYSHGD